MPLKKLLHLFALLLLAATGTVLLTKHASPGETRQTAILPAPPEPAVQHDEFGIVAGNLRMVDLTVKRNQTFSEILSHYNVSPETIARLVEVAQPVFDVRRIRTGSPYRVYQRDGTARYLVYQPSQVDYVVFDLQDSLRVYQAQRPVTIEQKTISGIITRSLWRTLEDLEAADLAVRLAEVFAWQIDFQRIQRGDHFTVLYEEEQIDGEAVGVGRILAARFSHVGNDFFAVRFAEGDVDDYFDENGNSLRKALLKSPLKFSRVTSGYSPRRFHPVQKRYKAHLGTDYAAPAGTEIFATGDGIVLEAQYKKYNGNYVKIRHNETYTTAYLHMQRIARGIRPGTRVRQGQVIGYVGSTGLATGPHVCYRFWKNGVQVDSRKEVLPPSHPVPPAYRADFQAHRDSLMHLLRASPMPAVAGRAEAPSAF